MRMKNNPPISKEEIAWKKREEKLLRVKVKKQSKCQRCISKFIDAWYTAVVMTAVTIYALFGDDIRFICLPIVVDDAWYAMTSVSIALFLIEIVLALYSKFEYWCSFFFFLDLVSSLSMIFDVGWVMDQLTNIGGSGV